MSLDQKTNSAARIVIPGVPMPLSYSIGENMPPTGVGSEVEVELGARKAKGWVIETLSEEQAASDLLQERKKQRRPLLQLRNPQLPSSQCFQKKRWKRESD